MKYSLLLLGICLGCLFTACKPDFNLNAPYKDVPVVYGILNFQDSIHYVKIYKGFQPKGKGAVFIDVQKPDSIYYYHDVMVVLEEYDANDKRTPRPDISLNITHDFPRDSGMFYYDKERIIYYTTEMLDKDMCYNIKITNKINGNVTQGRTSLVGFFEIKNSGDYEISNRYSPYASIRFNAASHAFDYEIHVNFLYFEVDKKTNQVLATGKIKKNITPRLGEQFEYSENGNYYYKTYARTFYDDIAAQLKPNSDIIRYTGTPSKPGICIEVEAWAAGESMFNFLLSNKPISSFVQVNTKYTNLTSNDLVFGFFSSRFQCPTAYFGITPTSQDSLVKGTKTGSLGFGYWYDYKP